MIAHIDLFDQINNAVLDLQASHYQTYDRHIKTLGRLLSHPDLADINETLTNPLNLDNFLDKTHASEGGMIGSDKLEWPEDPKIALGYTLLLIKRFANDPNWMADFAHTYYYSGRKISDAIHTLAGQLIIPFIRDYKMFVDAQGYSTLKLTERHSTKIFIVHGHDEGARESAARFLELAGLEPVILHEQANKGMTIIEKVEAHSHVGFAIVILTPDDQGSEKGGTLKPRARQNVLLELGYFIGKLGRNKVCALKRGELEIPSDFAGIVWHPMDTNSGWKPLLGRELQAAGYQIDWNKVMV